MKLLLSPLFLLFLLQNVNSQGKLIPPLLLDSNFSSLPITSIGMLPTADYRADRAKPFKQAEYLRKWLCPNLKKKGYQSLFTGDSSLTSEVLALNSVMSFSDSLSSYLGEDKYRFVFLPMIVAGQTDNFIIGKKVTASIVGIIFDKEQKKIVWMNEAEGEDGGIGGLSLLSGALAIDSAIYLLMRGLPKVKKE